MRIVLVMLYYDAALAPQGADAYLQCRPHQLELAAALAGAGHDVEVVILFPSDATLARGRVSVRLVSPGLAASALGAAAQRLGRPRACFEPAVRAIDVIVRARADVVHFHGTNLHLNLALLASRLRGEALVVQYHGGGPAKRRLARRWQRAGLARADRVLFTSTEQAGSFIAAGVLDGPDRVRAALEVSTSMMAPDRHEARRRSGLVGDPIFVCAGRLHPDKDPLTVLRGFEIVARSWPGARLYLCYLTDELLPALRRFVDGRPPLSERVRFLGRVGHEDMAAILGSADFLVQASLREVASYAVIEAIAAGAWPVVTDIPALREIVAGGPGILFAPGDHEALARGVLGVDLRDLADGRAALRTHFQAHLSFAAIARRFETIYREIVGSRRRVVSG